MNNLYHKVAVASMGIVLSLTLGANKEAKAFGVPEIFGVQGNSSIGIGQNLLTGPSISVQRTSTSPIQTRFFTEYDFTGFSLNPPGVASYATFEASVQSAQRTYTNLYLELFGYVGNGIAEVSDFNAGVSLGSQSVFTPYPVSLPVESISFDVTSFVNDRLSNGDNFWGFGLRVQNSSLNYGSVTVYDPTLTVSSEPVPEPLTIFSAAAALGYGAILKRKYSKKTES